MVELIAHLFGDYIFQSGWMAENKRKSWLAALVHIILYTLPFLFITFSPFALFFIGFSHLIIDRFGLARYVVYAKNFIAPISESTFFNESFDCECGVCNFCNSSFNLPIIQHKYHWENCNQTGYPSQTPIWLATWLLIIADNAIHLLINNLAIKFL